MILQEFTLSEKDMFRNFLRMNTDTFDNLVRLVYPALRKSLIRLRKPLSVEEKLACTSRYLATDYLATHECRCLSEAFVFGERES